MSQTMITKINKMDNTMTAVLSTIMIVFGFTTGLIVSDLLGTIYINKLHGALNKAADTMFEKDQQIDDLKEKLDQEKDLNLNLIQKLSDEKQRTSDILTSVQNVVEVYDDSLPRVIDPPRGPLKRSRVCMELGSEQEFEQPTSPETGSCNKD